MDAHELENTRCLNERKRKQTRVKKVNETDPRSQRHWERFFSPHLIIWNSFFVFVIYLQTQLLDGSVKFWSLEFGCLIDSLLLLLHFFVSLYVFFWLAFRLPCGLNFNEVNIQTCKQKKKEKHLVYFKCARDDLRPVNKYIAEKVIWRSEII